MSSSRGGRRRRGGGGGGGGGSGGGGDAAGSTPLDPGYVRNIQRDPWLQRIVNKVLAFAAFIQVLDAALQIGLGMMSPLRLASNGVVIVWAAVCASEKLDFNHTPYPRVAPLIYAYVTIVLYVLLNVVFFGVEGFGGGRGVLFVGWVLTLGPIGYVIWLVHKADYVVVEKKRSSYEVRDGVPSARLNVIVEPGTGVP
uniref:Uncharacterized protein n=1 Tax=Phaeomonas parva TaxID=124430 RepID=A0A7S1XPT9_9STRA|mmetsp:Transcript_2783/g.8090  ORF Transcript_2783/g.8090 Transcript_2783/m.8090 type:complete len:197 (+) Transcript_2783:115-705(+)